MSDQFGRKAGLLVSVDSDGIDLSDMHFRFTVSAADVQSPNTAWIRVYNLAEGTERLIRDEFNRVMLQAGYVDSNYGVIFDGTIKQVRRGRENAIDNYVDIHAADGDTAYVFGTVSASVEAGTTVQDRLNVVFKGMGLEPGYVGATGGILPRGKVLFGMGRDQLRNMAVTHGTSWSIQQGRVYMIPKQGYLPGEAVVLTSRTGLVGRPETTQDGVMVRCLLNPRIGVGTLLHIDNKSINETVVREQGYPQFTSIQLIASTSEDGLYRTLVVEHEGDTRGNSWHSRITCLAVDATAPADRSVSDETRAAVKQALG